MNQNQPYIELVRQREFNEVLSDTVEVLRQIWKPLLKTIAIYLGPLIIVSVGISSYAESTLLNVEQTLTDPSLRGDVARVSQSMSSYTVLVVLSTFVLYSVSWMVLLVTICAVRAYRDGHGVLESSDILRHTLKHFFPLLVANLITGILIALSVIGVFVGIVITSVYLSVQPACLILEKTTILQSIKRSFVLVQNAWWFTLGVLITVTMIVYVCAFSFAFLHEMIFVFFDNAGFSKNATSVDTLVVIGILFSMASKIIFTLLSVLPAIAITVLWGSHVERREGAGIVERVASIGDGV